MTTSSYLVRIYDFSAESGALVGRVTEVESGVAMVFQSADELVTLLQASAAERRPHGKPSTEGAQT